MIALDELARDPFELVCAEAREQAPGVLECLLDRSPIAPLADELPLEVVHEGEDAAVVVRERLLTHDGAETAQLAASAEERGQLVGDTAMVGACAPLADPGKLEAFLGLFDDVIRGLDVES